MLIPEKEMREAFIRESFLKLYSKGGLKNTAIFRLYAYIETKINWWINDGDDTSPNDFVEYVFRATLEHAAREIADLEESALKAKRDLEHRVKLSEGFAIREGELLRQIQELRRARGSVKSPDMPQDKTEVEILVRRNRALEERYEILMKFLRKNQPELADFLNTINEP